MKSSAEILADVVAGKLKPEDIQSHLAPGCKYSSWVEHQDVLEADKPVKHESRTCHAINGCDDSSQNSDANCSDWA